MYAVVAIDLIQFARLSRRVAAALHDSVE